MKKYLLIVLLLAIFASSSAHAATDGLSGRILLQVEDKGQAWYVESISNRRAYLGRPEDALRVMRKFGLGISEAYYRKIKEKAPSGMAGLILVRVEAKGEAYYVNPASLSLISLGRPNDAFALFRKAGIGISTADLNKIAVNPLFPDNAENSGKTNSVKPDTHKVIKVVDGDTIDVLVASAKKRVRIIGINTPEVAASGLKPGCYGEEASSEAKKILSGKFVRLEGDPTQDDVDKYGRILRYVYVDGYDFGKYMIEKGFAKEYTFINPYKHQVQYKEAQAEAKAKMQGLWSSENCGSVPASGEHAGSFQSSSDVYISYIFYNGIEGPKEGDEFVEIKNKGANVNLKGYVLFDEGGKKYVFGDFGLGKDKSVKIYTGCGMNNSESLYWCNTESAIWNNGGDRAYLKNAAGEIIAKYSY